jgi:PAS domain S-box-containing protein
MGKMRVAPLLALIVLFATGLPAHGADKVVLQLCWDHQFQFAGYYAAAWQGFYQEAGLEVEIRPALQSGLRFLNPPDEVASGRADFGVGEANILVAAGRGAPLVILTSVFQHSGVELYALRQADLTSPAHIAGMRILRRQGDLGEVQLQAMLRAEGYRPSDLTFVPLDPQRSSVEMLRQGAIDAILGFSLTTPFLFEQAGIAFSRIRPSMYGVDFYGDSLFSTQQTVRDRPELVEHFVKASLRGWKYALANPEEIARRITEELPRIYPPRDGDLLRFNLLQAEEVLRLADSGYQELGHVNPERWGAMLAYLQDTGLIEQPVDISLVVYDPVAWIARADRGIWRVTVAALAGASGLALLSLVWAVVLRRAVRSRTAELTAANLRLEDEVARRTRVEEDLGLSELLYRTLFENAALPLVLLEEDETVAMANSEFLKLAGRSREEVEGRMRWRDFFSPGGQKSIAYFHGELRSSPGSVPRFYDAELVDAGGGVRHVHLSTALIPGTSRSIASLLDITGRKLVEDALRRSEERYRAIFENTPAGIIQSTPDGRCLNANPEMAKIYGYESPREMIESVTDIGAQVYCDPEERSWMVATLESAGEVRFESRHRRKDGQVIWVATNLRRLQKDGQVYYEGFVTDVTAQKQAEMALVESEAQKQAILDSSVDMMTLIDFDMRIVWANRKAGEVVGVPPEGLIGRKCHEAYQGSPAPCPGCPCRMAMESGRIEHATMYRPAMRLVGESYWDDYGVPIFETGGRVSGIIEIARDVTARKHADLALLASEARYRTITENFPGGIMLLDADLRVLATNTTLRQWFPEQDFGPAQRCYELLGKSAACEVCLCREVLGHGQARTAVKELEIGGRPRVLKITACPLPDRDQPANQAMLIFSDITEEVRLQERLQKITRAELVTTMGSGIAHEVNQPLNAVKLWTTGLLLLLERDPGTDTRTVIEQLRKIQMASDRIANVINHMRMLVRHGDKVVVEPACLNEAVRSSLSLVSAKLAHHGIRTELDLDPSDPWVMANPIQLEQVIINLVANAVEVLDAQAGKGKVIAIGTRREETTATLVVEDSGPGIKGDVERIFDPFYTTKEVGQGMGLGLSLVQSFVTSWGGVVRAGASRSHKGARMAAELKLAGPAEAGERAAS